MGVNRAEVRKLIVDLHAIPGDMRDELSDDIRDGAEIVLDEMHRRASWSTRIPGATTMRASGIGADISTSTVAAPHAPLYEGLAGDPFRHPVFGNRENWVSQAARPFFYGAVGDKAADVEERVGRGIDRVIRRHGFH
jgi:hypothetical protein